MGHTPSSEEYFERTVEQSSMERVETEDPRTSLSVKLR